MFIPPPQHEIPDGPRWRPASSRALGGRSFHCKARLSASLSQSSSSSIVAAPKLRLKLRDTVVAVVAGPRLQARRALPFSFGIVDRLAGPGGLGEGFASFVQDGLSPFRIDISVGKKASVHRTLTLRAFLREYRARHGALPSQFMDFHARDVPEPDWSGVDADAWELAVEDSSRARATPCRRQDSQNRLRRDSKLAT